MKTKNPSQSKAKPKLSFSVDRDEFEISSDWVQAVMAQPSLPRREGPFFSPAINNATDTLLSTEEFTPTGAINPPVEKDATGTLDATVAVSLEQDTTGANNATVVEPVRETVPAFAEVAPAGPVPTNSSTVVNNSPGRVWKMKPIRRITDGLTPGQFAVYSMMWSNAEPGQGGERIYHGGYADLGRLTGLSKRGIQNVIAELQEKIVIHLHTPPGHHRSQTSAYRVPSAEAVVGRWYERGWRFAVGKNKRLSNGATVAEYATGDAA